MTEFLRAIIADLFWCHGHAKKGQPKVSWGCFWSVDQRRSFELLQVEKQLKRNKHETRPPKANCYSLSVVKTVLTEK